MHFVFTINKIFMDLFIKNSFWLHKIGFGSYSGGTHSLQRIHYEQVM